MYTKNLLKWEHNLCKILKKKKVNKMGKIKCQWNLHEISTKWTAENVNEMYAKNGFIMSIKSAKNVCKV